MSLFVSGYVLYIAYSKGLKMLGLRDPYIYSLESSIDSEELGQVSIKKLPTFFFSVIEDEFDNESDLGADDYRQYFHVTLKNKVLTYKKNDKGEMEESEKTIDYKMTRCTLDLVKKSGSDFEERFWNYYMVGKYFLCVDDPENKIYLQGSRESAIEYQDSAYFTVEIDTCSEKTRDPWDPPCASDQEIFDYLERKYFVFKVINRKIDFGSF